MVFMVPAVPIHKVPEDAEQISVHCWQHRSDNRGRTLTVFGKGRSRWLLDEYLLSGEVTDDLVFKYGPVNPDKVNEALAEISEHMADDGYDLQS